MLFWCEWTWLSVGVGILLSSVSDGFRWWGAFDRELRGLRFRLILVAYGEPGPNSGSAEGDRAPGDSRSPLYDVMLLAPDRFHVEAKDEPVFGPRDAVEESDPGYWLGLATGEFLFASICIERR